MKKLLAALVFSFLICSFSFAPNINKPMSKQEELRAAMHKLWEDHITWTRNVILNIMDGLPGTDQAVTRLLKNQDDIGNAIKPYYGDAAGTELTRLLKFK